MARLLRDQGYAATGRAQLVTESRVSNGSLYHHFPGGMDELAEAALNASGLLVERALNEAFEQTANPGLGVCRFLDMASPAAGEPCPGCPIAPTALESPAVNPRLRAVAARWFDAWESLIASRLRADGWPEESVAEMASAAISLIEGALLLARVTGQVSHIAHAKGAALTLLTKPNGRALRRQDQSTL